MKTKISIAPSSSKPSHNLLPARRRHELQAEQVLQEFQDLALLHAHNQDGESGFANTAARSHCRRPKHALEMPPCDYGTLS